MEWKETWFHPGMGIDKFPAVSVEVHLVQYAHKVYF